MSTVFDLGSVAEPQFVLTLKDGTRKSYDLLEVSEKLEEGLRLAQKEDASPSSAAIYDVVRRAFGFPADAEVQASAEDPKPFTLSRNACAMVQARLYELVKDLPSNKKLRDLAK